MVGYNKAPLRRLLSQATQTSGVEPELQGNMILSRPGQMTAYLLCIAIQKHTCPRFSHTVTQHGILL